MSEYFFDYKIKKVSGADTVRTPKLYFERDYRNSALPYHLFAVPKEWVSKQSVFREISGKPAAEQERALSSLEYDSVRYVYDISGLNCAPLTDPSSDEYRESEIKDRPLVTFEDFWEQGNGCRILIEDKTTVDHSGVGIIEMLKGGKSVATFFFAVNFAQRKKIGYYIDATGNRVSLKFVCPDRPQNINVRLLYAKDRLPCLKDDSGVNIVDDFELDFSRGGEYAKTVELSGDAAARKNYFHVTFAVSELEKYYLLDCLGNSAISRTRPARSLSTVNDACPYCHRKISAKIANQKGYKSGGAAGCGSDKLVGPEIRTKKNSPAKHALYCAGDLNPDNPKQFDPETMRLLPSDYLNHDRYKIAFVGSTRAGKTTYISRFFDLSGAEKVGMPMVMTANGLQNFGVSVKPASIPLLKRDNDKNGAYVVQDVDWTDTHTQYINRSINLYPSKYPKPTPEGDYNKYPFIAEVNGGSYVSFYDISGEDAKYSRIVENVANGECIGVFCIVNGKKDVGGNQKVSEMLNKANLNPNCPVAVILTKMDIIENEFDSNCHCLRSDYFNGAYGNYEGSDVENEIDVASEEIKSYLMSKELLPNIKFNNIKYFCVSSFNFRDSIHNENEDINQPGTIKFVCSSKRLEMPFLWMLKQFGVII